ncbi:MAG TPA: hypothetical protein PLA43_13275 [Bryobacteraceae bacterium]|nr:hypothetical protein [Bryobacteraceae bacterium]HOL72996.1 hypothetical protein [Bryobacteraceae bacterium]HOQ43946.1 hypothetical protein [Bryobacteraceae bacterium]HPQ14763.1 hypothetical protein [Bryobacteraceae bacterium]HPU72924.1 hypothetical protein [Bryobacteraceae bacterium]
MPDDEVEKRADGTWQEDEDDDDLTMIDLTDEVNANWRDLLRANPKDPRFTHPTIKGIHLTPVERLPEEEQRELLGLPKEEKKEE